MGTRGPIKKESTKQLGASGIPQPPDWLCKTAKVEYFRIAGILNEEGVVEQVDMAILSSYAQAYADVARLTVAVREDGESVQSDKGNWYLNPDVGVLNNANARQTKAAAMLGFSPVDRGRVSKVAKPKSSPFAGLV